MIIKSDLEKSNKNRLEVEKKNILLREERLKNEIKVKYEKLFKEQKNELEIK